MFEIRSLMGVFLDWPCEEIPFGMFNRKILGFSFTVSSLEALFILGDKFSRRSFFNVFLNSSSPSESTAFTRFDCESKIYDLFPYSAIFCDPSWVFVLVRLRKIFSSFSMLFSKGIKFQKIFFVGGGGSVTLGRSSRSRFPNSARKGWSN